MIFYDSLEITFAFDKIFEQRISFTASDWQSKSTLFLLFKLIFKK
jgi:hypothetical protein